MIIARRARHNSLSSLDNQFGDQVRSIGEQAMQELGNIMSEVDMVDSPPHYGLFPDMEVIDIIKATLTPEEFAGYCKGNVLKYRLRAGEKGDVNEDIAKADKYNEWLGDIY